MMLPQAERETNFIKNLSSLIKAFTFFYPAVFTFYYFQLLGHGCLNMVFCLTEKDTFK